MKLTAIILLSALSLTACKKEYNQVVNQVFSALYDIPSAQWQTSDNGASYHATLQVQELDNVIVNSGGVEVYLSFDGGSTWEAIPEVFNGIAYGSVHAVGTVTVDIQAGDGSGSAINPPAGLIKAKVVLLDGKALN